MTDFEKLRQAAKQSDTYPATVIYASDIRALLVAYDAAEQRAKFWERKASEHAENAMHWRQRAEAAEDEGSTCD